ncbi:elongation factor 1-alpha [Verticillium alfalfae VaMs.102]|uniref:Elongation factor 1-alpha n=1 Tax=Verticillium alfalfae (strain VaMs.102 / ATCC MYA-4576 / FGSC 10136) TaxID=526221 RepID=C9SSS2_VERA1|nr:elongation factor 1-alpha [Verticillium alfalfae VaMs.102]EEY21837.1 elongation factor 1-alpha [Verticillium alfalfae VaMs.102]
MSRHQAVRNLDYEEVLDEYDADDGELGADQLTPEDRDALAKGAEQVRETLGSAAGSLTTQQIHDALWYYYYDIEKTVDYLLKKYITPPTPKSEPKKPKEGKSLISFLASSWKQGPGSAEVERSVAGRTRQQMQSDIGNFGMASSYGIPSTTPWPPPSWYFEDMPWMNVPKHRQAIMVPPVLPVGRLLGGGEGPKVSKLQALAAARKKKSEAVKKPEESEERTQKRLAELNINEQTYEENVKPGSSILAKRQKLPSPDDIGLAAQAKAGNRFDAAAAKSATAAKKAPKSNGGPPTEAAKDLSLDDAPPPKSKKINVLQEFENSKSKRSASFVHLIDRYRRQAEKLGKSSFALAWVMDQREEERERGVTIDIATNQFETDKTQFTILDAPGHRDFVPNMIAGASQADFAVLVIDANTGAFEKGLKGQTREHALLLRSLGVQRVIVAVNKLDMVGWSEERFNEISEQVTGFMKGNGFQLKNVTFVPISGLNGDNLAVRSEDPALSWYKGETLIQALEDSEPLARALEKPFRMSISEIFKSQQSQLTISGRMESGTVQTGESIVVQPSGEQASIRSIEVDTEIQDWAVAGQNVSLGVYGIDPIHIRVGDIISSKAEPIETSDLLTMKVLAFEHLMPMPVDVHRGRLHAAGRIQSIPAVLNKTTGATEKKNPKVVAPAKVARVVVKLESKVPLEAGQRVVLRMGGETVAAGLLE